MTSRLVSWKEKNLSTLGAVASILYGVSSAKVVRTYHRHMYSLGWCKGKDRVLQFARYEACASKQTDLWRATLAAFYVKILYHVTV